MNGLRVLFNLLFEVKKNYIPKYLTAAVLFKINRQLKVINLKIPKLKEGQVLVKIFYSGICRSQIMEIFGGRENKRWLPHLLGHEASGKVIQIGKNVKKVKPEDDVILTWIKASGLESKTPDFFYKNKKINAGKVTTFSNYSIVSENRLVKKPRSINAQEAIFFGCAFPTGAGMVFNEIKTSKNDNIVLIGLGAVGLGTLLALKKKEIKNIIVIDKNKKKLNLANKLGVKYTFSSLNNLTKNKVNKIFKNGADICFESAGLTKTIEFGMDVINNNGKVHFASHPSNKEIINIKPHDLIKGKKISGSWGGGTKPDRDVKKFTTILKQNKFKLQYICSKIYSLNKINLAINDFKKNLVFRPIIKMHH